MHSIAQPKSSSKGWALNGAGKFCHDLENPPSLPFSSLNFPAWNQWRDSPANLPWCYLFRIIVPVRLSSCQHVYSLNPHLIVGWHAILVGYLKPPSSYSCYRMLCIPFIYVYWFSWSNSILSIIQFYQLYQLHSHSMS